MIPSDKDDPTFLERTPDGNFAYKPLQRRVAESVLSQGGKIKLVGSDATIARLPDLPKGSIRIEEIDLGGVASIPAEEIELITKLTASLKRLVLPKIGVSRRQLDEIRECACRTARSNARRKLLDATCRPDYSGGLAAFGPLSGRVSKMRRAWRSN